MQTRTWGVNMDPGLDFFNTIFLVPTSQEVFLTNNKQPLVNVKYNKFGQILQSKKQLAAKMLSSHFFPFCLT
jgi:hypothetical protein